ncbi:hypothetical protein BT93_E1204 [Corymbia citriodora subsp. variegata]|nr:hypothetical protein BT93_E1204 [Corymbia citriodora subsp. variegata]
MIPESCPDGAAGPCGMVREDLVLVILPQSSVDVDSRKYNLNGKNCNMQIMIHFVAAKIPADGGKVHLKQHHDANGVKVATDEVVFLHYEIKAKGKLYLTCGEGGKVMEVSDEFLTKEITMAPE